MEPKIGMICSDVRLAKIVRKAAERRNVLIEIRPGSLDAAIPVGRQMEAEGAEAIICSSGTASVVRKSLSIPIIGFQYILSTFDLMEEVSSARKIGRNIGIGVYGTPLSGVELLEKIFQVKIKQVVYQDAKSLSTGIHRAKKDGIDVYIGRNLASEICREVDLPCVFFDVPEENVISAIDEAIRIICVRREEREKTKRVEAILNSVSEGMIAIDRNGQINVFNKVAEEILGVKDPVGRRADELVARLGLPEVLDTGKPKFQRLQKIGGVQIMSNLVPICLGTEVIGAIASFTDVSKVMSAENNVRRSFTKGFVAKYTLDDIVCGSASMKRLIEQTRQFALSDSTILLTGESGTGKELIAHSIHNLSARKEGPFVVINCSALPENLLESELFGYEEGAFTGAKRSGKPGLFELAHQGSIFLDEIGSISEAVQSRLLRVLQQKEVMRISGDRIIPVNVRIIAATNMDLLRMVKQGRMRMDLYFRLNILRIHIPPLRERKEDIPILVNTFLESQSRKYGKRIGRLPKKLIARLLAHPWPGNVRELNNLIERLVIMSHTPDNYGEVLDLLFQECLMTERVLFEEEKAELPAPEGHKDLFDDSYKKKALAKMMGISRTTLWRRTKTNNIH